MHIKLAYGSDFIPIDVPDNWINGRCYRPHPMQPCADARAELMATLSGLPADFSLPAVTKDRGTLAIAVDGESASVCQELLPALVEMIEDETSIRPGDITVVVSNRLWQPIGADDLAGLVPDSVREHYRVVLHDPADPDAVRAIGETSRKIPVTINKHYLDSEVKIVLGAVKPDLLFGFSGGRAVVMPGLAGPETLRAMYDFNFVADKNTRYGNFRDNPFHITGVECTNAAGCSLCISAVLTPSGQIHKLTAGHFGQSHLMAMNIAREAMTVKVKEPMDIVVASGGGAPFDETLIQLVSTLCAVEHVLKPDGTIVVSAALEKGVGAADLEQLVRAHSSIGDTMERLAKKSRFIPGQWVAQRLYTILQDHEVMLYNKHIEEDVIWSMGFTPATDLNEAVLGAMQNHGQRCKIVALPDGPMSIGEVQR